MSFYDTDAPARGMKLGCPACGREWNQTYSPTTDEYTDTPACSCTQEEVAAGYERQRAAQEAEEMASSTRVARISARARECELLAATVTVPPAVESRLLVEYGSLAEGREAIARLAKQNLGGLFGPERSPEEAVGMAVAMFDR